MKNNEKLIKNSVLAQKYSTKIRTSALKNNTCSNIQLKNLPKTQNNLKTTKAPTKNNEKLLKNSKNKQKINKNNQKIVKKPLKNKNLLKNLKNISQKPQIKETQKITNKSSKNIQTKKPGINKNAKNNLIADSLLKSSNKKNTIKPQTNKVCGVEISSPNKILFKKDKITKLDVANYYNDIAPLMLKFLDKRLLSVIRCHIEANESCFFKKHPTTDKSFVNTCFVEGEEYFYITNKTQLVLQAQMGTVEFHIWGSKLPNINQPNLMVFDLDPAPDVSLKTLREACLCVKQILDELKLKSFLKTSGGKGYHICVPFKKKLSWDNFADFSHNIALLLEQKYPNLFTTTIKKSARKGKIFIDYLRNKKGATCVAPYSLRAREHAFISFPIKWSQLNEIAPNEITIKNYKKYL